MDTRHAPSPWAPSGLVGFIEDAEGDTIAHVTMLEGTPDLEEMAQANIRLIAAAPEMLEALKGLLAMPAKYRAAAEEMARVAIAKAEGR